MFYVNLVHGEVMGLEMNLLPVFNVADAAITVGIVAIIIFQRRFFKASATEAASTEEDTIAAAASEAATAPEQAP